MIYPNKMPIIFPRNPLLRIKDIDSITYSFLRIALEYLQN